MSERADRRLAEQPSEVLAEEPIMRPPALVIEITVEGRPCVRQVVGNEAEELRLQFWVKSQPRLHRLVYDAVQLMREAA